MFAAAVAGVGATGCGSGDSPVPVYGAPFDAAQFDTATTDTGTTDTGRLDTPDTKMDFMTADSAIEAAADANDTADAEETRIFPPYGAPSTPVAV